MTDTVTPDFAPYSTIGEAAYRQLRADIIFARLQPGERLRLERMREVYGASVNTLREALTRLHVEGFVVAEEQRGFHVSQISERELRELAALRLLLECDALNQSFAAGDLDWEGRVVAAHHKLSVVEKRLLAGEEGETETWRRFDREFHQALISACGSVSLMSISGVIYDRYLRYMIVALSFRGELTVNEHALLFDCARSRNGEKARLVLTKHVNDCVEHAVAAGLRSDLAGKLLPDMPGPTSKLTNGTTAPAVKSRRPRTHSRR